MTATVLKKPPAITNRRRAESGPDFYATPRWATWLLLKYEPLEGTIWEPACGEGDMAEVIKQVGYEVLASDLYDRGYGKSGVDFTDRWEIERCAEQPGKCPQNVVTNPPFALAEQFFESGYAIAQRKVCLLLRTAFVESARRYRDIFQHTPPVRIWTFSERLSMYPKGYDVKASGTTSYSWFVWDKQDKSGKTELKWFPPGSKPKGR